MENGRSSESAGIGKKQEKNVETRDDGRAGAHPYRAEAKTSAFASIFQKSRARSI